MTVEAANAAKRLHVAVKCATLLTGLLKYIIVLRESAERGGNEGRDKKGDKLFHIKYNDYPFTTDKNTE